MTKHINIFFYILVVCMVMAQSASAQILFGPKVGYHASTTRYAKLYGGVDYTEDMTYAPQIGALYGFNLSSKVSFYSELYYSQRGKNEKTNDLITLLRSHEARYHFLELPLMLRLTFPFKKSAKSPKAYINAGPHIAYWLAGKGTLTSLETYGSTELVQTEYTIHFKEEETQENVLFAEDANRLQFGLNIGSGVVIPLNKKGDIFQFDLRYTWGSTFMGSNLNLPIATSGVEENYSFGHSQISVSIAYAFHLDILGMRRGKSTRRR
ncbi:porin family protein [Catalinimonas niigatensis]|uniref:porin family protein n=1 Tax=Catalinimonas niigatensis TaxID=1397264 RepID=UPI0026668E09|nr:porin family protein [Catalinimonas niigatensis]WPP51154.1 porin family protein [Catalinimonas niigatensis]